MKRRRFLWLCAGLICICVAVAFIRANLPAQPVTKSFPAAGVKRVVIRASQARVAKVSSGGVNQIQVSGLPSGGAKGYHSPDQFWRETPAKSWGLDFVAKQYGSVLVISTENEIGYIHHHYVLENLNIQVPKGIKVIKEERTLTGDGKPNLKKPA